MNYREMMQNLRERDGVFVHYFYSQPTLLLIHMKRNPNITYEEEEGTGYWEKDSLLMVIIVLFIFQFIIATFSNAGLASSSHYYHTFSLVILVTIFLLV